MKKLKLYFKYYSTIGLLPFLVTVFMLASFYKDGFSVIIPIIFSKIFVFTIIWGLQWINFRRDENLYFYYNNGISKIQLYLMAFLFDTIVMLILIIPTLWLF